MSHQTNSGRVCIFLGPIPPPTNGLAVITDAVRKKLCQEGVNVITCNLSGNERQSGYSYHLSRLKVHAMAAFVLVKNRKRERSTAYVALNDGLGLVYSLSLVLISRLLGYSIILHLHSFRFLKRRSKLLSLLNKIAGTNATRVFLCKEMEKVFFNLYSPSNGIVISNIIFLSDPLPVSLVRKSAGIGHMSNLSEEKGLYRFLRLFEDRSLLHINGILAGPANANDLKSITKAVQSSGGRLKYLGPIYGRRKEEFFASIDIFVFPSLYRTEAEPVVLYEAKKNGVPVIAYKTGCIAEQLGVNDVCLQQGDDMAGYISSMYDLMNSEHGQKIRFEIVEEYREKRKAAQLELDYLIKKAGDPRNAH